VAAFDENIGLQLLDQFERRILLEHDYGVHHLQGREDVTSLRRRSDRALGSLEPAHGVIAVHADHERFSVLARAQQHVHVSRMQEIEHAVGEDHSALLEARLPPNSGGAPTHDLVERVSHRAQRVPTARGWKWMSRMY